MLVEASNFMLCLWKKREKRIKDGKRDFLRDKIWKIKK